MERRQEALACFLILFGNGMARNELSMLIASSPHPPEWCWRFDTPLWDRDFRVTVPLFFAYSIDLSERNHRPSRNVGKALELLARAETKPIQ